MPDRHRRDIEFARHIPDLSRAARRLARSHGEAEDLVQEAILRVWSRLANGAEVRDLRPYLFATLRNLARRPAAQGDELTDRDVPVVAPSAHRRLVTAEVLSAIGGLPPEQASLIRGLAVEGASYAELARRHNLPVGTVMSRVSRGRARLAERLGVPKHAPVTALLEEIFTV